MTTKDKIADTALLLFNTIGMESVTVRDIASKMKISVGNLSYHFPKKDSIIELLYDNLVKELDNLTALIHVKKPGVKLIYDTIQESFTILYKYRFLLADLLYIMRKYPALNKKFQKLLVRREQEFVNIFNFLKSHKLLRNDFKEEQYQFLFRQFFIISNAWAVDCEIFYRNKGKEHVRYYAVLVFSMLVPYFTRTGMIEYQLLIKSRFL